MLQPATLRNDLESKSDLEWFDAICDLLKRDKHPTTHQLTELIGGEKPNPNNEIRGSKFLIPYDNRFVFACINPNLSPNDTDKPIEYLAVGGKDFSLKMSDLLLRFPEYRTQGNTYDGGTQIFFYPVSEEYEFSALSFDVDKEPEEIENIVSLVFHSVTFKFLRRCWCSSWPDVLMPHQQHTAVVLLHSSRQHCFFSLCPKKSIYNFSQPLFLSGKTC